MLTKNLIKPESNQTLTNSLNSSKFNSTQTLPTIKITLDESTLQQAISQFQRKYYAFKKNVFPLQFLHLMPNSSHSSNSLISNEVELKNMASNLQDIRLFIIQFSKKVDLELSQLKNLHEKNFNPFAKSKFINELQFKLRAMERKQNEYLEIIRNLVKQNKITNLESQIQHNESAFIKAYQYTCDKLSERVNFSPPDLFQTKKLNNQTKFRGIYHHEITQSSQSSHFSSEPQQFVKTFSLHKADKFSLKSAINFNKDLKSRSNDPQGKLFFGQKKNIKGKSLKTEYV